MAGEEELTVGHAGLEVWYIRRCPGGTDVRRESYLGGRDPESAN